MIEINLLPQQEAKGRKPGRKVAAGSPGGGLETAAVLMLAAVMTVLVFSSGFYSYSQVKAAQDEVEAKRRQLRAVEAEIAKHQREAQTVRRMRQVLNNQWELLQALDPPDRILWSEKLEMLATLMPPNVFLSQIDVVENVVEVETKASIERRRQWEANRRQGPRPPVVRKPIITYVLTVKGLATGADNIEQFDNVLKFHQALISHKTVDHKGAERAFMDGFNPNIEFESVLATLFEGVPVNEFSFKLRTKPLESTEGGA
jgi:Tfp pilus assembly protein PilN